MKIELHIDRLVVDAAGAAAIDRDQLAREVSRALAQLRPDLPHALSDVLVKALSKDPNDRYQSSREMIAAAKVALTAAPPPERAMEAEPTASGMSPALLEIRTRTQSPPSET